jgi:3-isopropylmalate dehydratase
MPSAVRQPQTLYDKVFQDHIVEEQEDGTILLYIGASACPIFFYISTDARADRHLVHEVTSPVSILPHKIAVDKR